MIKVLLHGCNGKMGQVMTRVIHSVPDMEIVAGVDAAPLKENNPYPVYGSLPDVKETPDVLVDFSYHTTVDSLIQYGTEKRVPLVICTTGHTPEEKSRMVKASERVAILNSANMSLGVNLLVSLVKQVASAVGDIFDIEIIEKHHNQKVDSPSGTALMIADAMRAVLGEAVEYKHGRHSKTEKRHKNEIGIHAVRGGAIVGEHDVIFAGQGEVIEIRHSALSRDLFAYGAIKAARFVAGKRVGFYTMADVIESS